MTQKETVRIAIGSEFLTAFAKLPKSQQKKARNFCDKFTRDPTGSGVNYETIKPEGCVTAELHVHPAEKLHAFEDSVAMTQGGTAEKATWKTGTVIPATPSASVFLRLENARVYAYELRDAE